MNIPNIYLAEPYNAYADPKTSQKKHWTQVLEEQALMEHIIAQQMLQEANAAVAQQQSATVGHAASAPGGGGQPALPAYFNPSMSIAFHVTFPNNSAPCTVQFLNDSDPSLLLPGATLWNWSFGDGTFSNLPAPTHIYTKTGSFIADLVATHVITNQVVSSSYSASFTTGSVADFTHSIAIIPPSITSSFTLTGASASLTNGFYTASRNAAINFVNGTTTTNPSNVLTYSWNFASGSNPTSSLTNPSFTYTATGSYTILLGATGSFNIMAAGARKIQII
jgi:PKD repeat protein